jgi:DNA polymerase-3 subunit beta
MSVHHANLGQPVATPLSIIVPARAMHELSRVLGDAGDVVEMTVSPNQSQLLVVLEDIWFTTRLIDGTFPDLSQIIPKDWNTRTVVGREKLLDAARRAAIFSRSANDVVRFDIAPASGAGRGRRNADRLQWSLPHRRAGRHARVTGGV